MTLIYKILERRVATHTEVGPGIYGTCRVGKVLLSTRQPAWSYWNLHNFSQVKKKKKCLLTEKENLWKPLCQTTPMTICPSAMWATSQPPLSPMISSELNFCFRRLPLSTFSSFLSVPARVLSTEFEFGQQDFLIRTLSPFFFFFFPFCTFYYRETGSSLFLTLPAVVPSSKEWHSNTKSFVTLHLC